MTIEAMKLALEALDDLIVYSWDDGKVGEPDKTEDYAGIKAMEALRAAIEQAEKQEPVAYPENFIDALRYNTALRETVEKQEPVAWWHDMGDVVDLNVSGRGTPLYLSPPQREWQGLTDEEIMDACCAVWASHPIEVGHVVQDLLKEKNT